MKEAFDTPTILESLATDISNGRSWEEVAGELYSAGWLNYVSVERAKRLLAPYLDNGKAA